MHPFMDAVKETDNTYSIEMAGLRDIGALRVLEQLCFPQDAWPLLDLIGVLTMPGVVRLKAVSGGRMIGFVAGDVRRWESVAWIATIGVLPERRGMGVGAALLEACEQRIPLGVIRLCVRTDNLTAIRMYERFGYLRKGEWSNYYQDGAEALVMEKVREKES
jgi:ribosomal protein S18 acetylase RimI-like enzyme